MRKHLTIITAFAFTSCSYAQWSTLTTDTALHPVHLNQQFTPAEWEASNFASPNDLKWFEDARYGMFIHFGLSTYVNKELSWGICHTRMLPDQGHGEFPDSIWTAWPANFKLDKFNAEEPIATAKKAGMKYIVVIAKHHDGWHLWDTKYSEFKVTNTPYGKDFLRQISNACHRNNMKFGIYYSQRDWHHPDYFPVDSALIDRINDPPYYKMKKGIEYKVPDRHRKYIEYQFNAVKELCTNYGKIDIFWFDALWWGGMFLSEMWDSENLTRMIRNLQPGIIINNRASIPGDFDTPEQQIGLYQVRPWESCMTLCGTWSYSPTPVKDKKQIVHFLTSAACDNGNLLLSWGPKWDGAFDEIQTTTLLEVGEWLQKYGNTIYNTHGGPWLPGEWGGSTFIKNHVFLHIRKIYNGKIVLPPIQNKIKNVKLLTAEGKVEYSQTDHQIVFTIDERTLNEIDNIIELTFEKPVGRKADS